MIQLLVNLLGTVLIGNNFRRHLLMSLDQPQQFFVSSKLDSNHKWLLHYNNQKLVDLFLKLCHENMKLRVLRF